MIAEFAPLVLTTQDPEAWRIRQEAAQDLADLVQAAARHFPVGKAQELFVVPAGGLWQNQPFRQVFYDLLPNHYVLIFPAMPPVFGAAVEAANQAGLGMDGGFERRFAASYQALREDGR